MTIHASDPFATPEEERSPVRRMRGRMPATVTLWTAYGRDGRPAGLTISSTVVADGEPAQLLGLLDEESDLYPALLHSGRFVVTALSDGDGQLADRFAGLFPAPGGLFGDGEWDATEHGPVRRRRHPWAACEVSSTQPVGYAVLVAGVIRHIELGADGADGAPPLLRHRGRYTSVRA